MSRFSKALYSFVELVWKYPKGTLLIIAAITALFAWQVPTVRIVSDFADLLPQDHAYIQVHYLTLEKPDMELIYGRADPGQLL